MLNHQFHGPGKGYIITLNPGIHMRKIKWKIDFYQKHAAPKVIRTFEIRLEADDVLVGKANTKTQALKLAKQLMGVYREPLICDLVYKVPNPRYKTFRLDYNSKERGKYIIFGPKKDFTRYEEVRADF